MRGGLARRSGRRLSIDGPIVAISRRGRDCGRYWPVGPSVTVANLCRIKLAGGCPHPGRNRTSRDSMVGSPISILAQRRDLLAVTSARPGLTARPPGWSQALRYCWRERGEWSDLQGFMRTQGGIAGCASAFANRKRPGKAQEKGQGDRALYHPIPKPNPEKPLAAIDRMRRSASNLASPELAPLPVTPASPAKIVTALGSRGLWPR